MPSQIPGSNQVQNGQVTALAALRHFNGSAKESWPKYLALLAGFNSGSKVALVVKAPDAPDGWKLVGSWAATTGPSRVFTEFNEQLPDIAKRCEADGSLLSPLKSVSARAQGHFVVAVRLNLR